MQMPMHHEAPGLLGFTDWRIANMPLEEVTELLGSEGLQRRCSLEIEQFPPDEQVQLDKAFHWAMDFHTKDTRYREPATNHILRVAIRIMHDYEVKDINLITAALLHDAVDQHTPELTGSADGTPEDALAILGAEFNPDVSSLVSSVTNPEYEADRDDLQQYQAYVAAILKNDDPRVRIIKVASITDNALTLIHIPSEGSVNRSRRYAALLPAFEEAILDPDTPLTSGGRAYIVKQLDETKRLLRLFSQNVS